MAHLRAVGPGREEHFALEKERVVVGRGIGADVQLQDRKASAAHCRIERGALGFEVFDLESQNGTYVNGLRVRKHPLRPGDLLQVGETKLRFEDPDAPLPAAPPAHPKAEKMLRRVDEALAEFAKVAAPGDHSALRERLRARFGAASADPEVERLRKLVSWIRRLTDERDHAKLLSLMLDSLVELTGAERGFLLLDDPPRVAVARNLDAEALRKPTFRVARGVAEQVARDGQAVLSMNAASDPRVRSFGDTGALHLRSVACVPIRAGKRVLGSLYLDSRFERGLFRQEDLPFLLSFADQAAVALENARLHAEAQRARAEVEELNGILRGRLEEQEKALEEAKLLYARAAADAQTKYRYDAIIGRSPAMRELFFLLDRVTDSDVPVFLRGESGSGKELCARAIHFNGPRKQGPFISENCAAIPEALFESELFGHVRGAFTGAVGDKKGLFQLADGGTLFLDEIAETPLAMQAKLLRALQEREARPVGARAPQKVDLRIVTASNRDLAELVRRGLFREDLYHRIHVIEVPVPPLRRRREDIALLVAHFLERIAQKRGETPKPIARAAVEMLERYGWPGNVRELENEIQRACALSDGEIRPEVLSDGVKAASSAGSRGRTLKESVAEAVREVERRAITEALRQHGGNKSAAARALGISRPTLDAKMEGLKIPRYPA